MSMIIKTRKRSRLRASKQTDLKSINTHYRIANPDVYKSTQDHNKLNPLRGIKY